MIFPAIKRWDLVLMVALLTAVTVFELLGVFNPKFITITALIKSTIPMQIRVMIYSWLGWHFILSDLVKQVAK
jgi:hypothetical protein